MTVLYLLLCVELWHLKKRFLCDLMHQSAIVCGIGSWVQLMLHLQFGLIRVNKRCCFVAAHVLSVLFVDAYRDLLKVVVNDHCLIN